MKLRLFTALSVLLLIAFIAVYFPAPQAEAAGKTLTVVGLYSETADGHVSYRIGAGKWIVVNPGDQIPENAEIGITVDRDWVEVIPSDNPNTVYEVDGNPDGKTVNVKVADLLKQKPRAVSFPKPGSKADPKFANKVVVKQYLGKQIYMDKSDRHEIKYGDIFAANGTVNIIATNNTLTLVLPNGKETKVVGPLKFPVQKVLKGENLYKFLNVTK